MSPPRKHKEPIIAPARNLIDPRESACRERCNVYKIPPDAVYEGKPMWTRFLDEVEMELSAIGSKAPPERND